MKIVQRYNYSYLVLIVTTKKHLKMLIFMIMVCIKTEKQNDRIIRNLSI